MGTALDNASVVKDKDFIHILQPHQPVGDEQEGLATRQCEEHIEDDAAR